MALDLTGIPRAVLALIQAEVDEDIKGFLPGLNPIVQTPPCFVVGPPAAVPSTLGVGSWDYLLAVGVRVPKSDRDPSYDGLATFTAQLVAVLDGASESWGSVRIDRIDAPTDEGGYLEQLIQLTVAGE